MNGRSFNLSLVNRWHTLPIDNTEREHMPNTLTIYAANRESGSASIVRRMDLNGAPYGVLYTFVASEGVTHPWHIKTLSGYYKAFWGDAFQTPEELAVRHARFITSTDTDKSEFILEADRVLTFR